MLNVLKRVFFVSAIALVGMTTIATADSPKASLQLTVGVNHPSATAPASLVYTFVITNTGSVSATAVKLDDTLPAEFRYVAADTHATLARLGDLGPGESMSKQVKVTVPAGTPSGRYVYEAIVSASNADPVQNFAGVDITAGKVLGASTTLVESGQHPYVLFLLGTILTILGFVFHRRLSA